MEITGDQLLNSRRFKMAAWIDHEQFGRGVRIWLYLTDAEGRTIGVVEPTHLTARLWGPEEEGRILEPALRLPNLEAPDLLAALKTAVERVVPVTDAHLKGQLEATKYHLEDLRSLLRLDSVTKVLKKIGSAA